MIGLIIAEEILTVSEDILTSQDAVNNITIITNIANTVNSLSQDVLRYVTQDVFPWIVEHKDWLLGAFSGIGLVALGFLYRFIKWIFSRRKGKLQINTNFYIAIEENVQAKILADVFARLNVNNAFNDIIANLVQAPSNIIYPVLRFEIVNVSTTETIIIKSVSWDFCGKKITYYGKLGVGGDKVDGVAQVDPNDPNKYNDKEIHPNGGVLKGSFKIAGFVIDKEFRTQFKKRDKIRLVICDRLGNRYYSKKYKYKEFVEQVAIAIVAAKDASKSN